MQDSSSSPTDPAGSLQLLERINRLESQLRERQLALGKQREALQEQLGQFGLETVEEILEAYESLDASHRSILERQLRPTMTGEPGLRTAAYRRVGRMV